MLVGERLRRTRAERGWTQSDAGRAVGVNQATICRAELGDAGPMATRLIEMQLDKLEHDNPHPVVGRGEPPTGSAKEEAAMPRGVSNTGTRGKRTQTQRAQSGGKNYQQGQAGLPATAHKQLNAFGKKLGTLQTGFQTLMTNLGGSGSGSTQSGGRGRGGARNQQTSQNI